MVVHSSRHRIAGPLIALLGMLALAAAPAQAETPPDTLVMAKDIADIITFDPAEAFEITTGELIANVYDRIMTFEPENPRTLTGGVASVVDRKLVLAHERDGDLGTAWLQTNSAGSGPFRGLLELAGQRPWPSKRTPTTVTARRACNA